MSRISPDFLDPSGGSAARRGSRPVVSAVGSVCRAERQRRRRVTTASARRRAFATTSRASRSVTTAGYTTLQDSPRETVLLLRRHLLSFEIPPRLLFYHDSDSFRITRTQSFPSKHISRPTFMPDAICSCWPRSKPLRTGPDSSLPDKYYRRPDDDSLLRFPN